MLAVKFARSSRGWPALKAVRVSVPGWIGKLEPRGTGEIRAVLMAGRPMRSTCTPLNSERAQTPIALLPARVSFDEGISRTIDKVLTAGPKKFGPSKFGVLPGPKPLGLVPEG